MFIFATICLHGYHPKMIIEASVRHRTLQGPLLIVSSHLTSDADVGRNLIYNMDSECCHDSSYCEIDLFKFEGELWNLIFDSVGYVPTIR